VGNDSMSAQAGQKKDGNQECLDRNCWLFALVSAGTCCVDRGNLAGQLRVSGWCAAMQLVQVRGIIIISRCTQRTCGAAEWKALQAQLGAWRDALKGVQVRATS
jgi:hypothetical protein